MFSIHDILHSFVVSFGVFSNVTAILVIFFKTHPALREYSLLLLNTSVIQLISILTHFLINGRLFIDSTTVFCISSGPCQYVSNNFCSAATGFMNINMVYLITILSISFWYRTRILEEKGVFGRIQLQTAIVVLYFPNVIHAAGFVLYLTPEEVLKPALDRYYGQYNITGSGLHGFIDTTAAAPAMLVSYLVIVPFISTAYIISTRRKLIRMLRAKMKIMSFRTHDVHESFIKALTIDAAMSSILFFVFTAFAIAQEFFHFHSIDIEGLEYDVAVLPALISPVLTLYFVRAYRTFIIDCVKRIFCRSSTSTIKSTITFQSNLPKQNRPFSNHNSTTPRPSCTHIVVPTIRIIID